MNYPIKFKAAILEDNNKPLKIDEVTFEGPLQAGQILTKITYTGICGKQIEEIDGKSNFQGKIDPFLPHLLGHEGAGIVVDIGPSVTKVSPGDYVVLHWLKGGGINSATPIYTRNNKRVNAGWITTFNEYGVISENRVTKISKDTNLEIACLLGCCVTTGVGVILNEAKPLPGDSIAIFGCGGVGLNAIQGAALINSYPIIAVDKNPKSLELSKKFKADYTIDTSRINPIEKIREITQGKGAKYVICSLSNPSGIESAIQSCSTPGNVYFVGVPPINSQITLNPFEIHSGKKLQGSQGGACILERDIPKYLDFYRRGLLKLDELITDSFSLDRINDGINLMKSGIPGRLVVDMNY